MRAPVSNHQRIRRAAVLMLVLLVGCASPERTPVAVRVQPTQAAVVIVRAPSASTASPVPRTIVQPTGSTQTLTPEPTQTPTLIQTSFPSATSDPLAPTPFATPIRAFQVPRFVDILPVDQPWMWDYGNRFLSVDRAGRLSQLQLPSETVTIFDSWITRPGETPLILETSDTQPPALFDPARGTHIPFDVPVGTLVSGFIVSSDSRQVVFLAVPQDDGERRVLIANIMDGTIHTILIHDRDLQLTPIAWHKDWLYLEQGESPFMSLWRLNLTTPHALPEFIERFSEYASYHVQPHGNLLLLTTQNADTLQLIDMHSAKGNSLEIPRCRADSPLCKPVFSPDGKQVVYVTDSDSQGAAHLMRYDIARKKTTILHTFHQLVSTGTIFWLDNSRHILLPTVSAGLTPSAPQHVQAVLFAMDGTLLDEASPDWARLQNVGYAGYLPVTDDNQQLVVDNVNGRLNLRALPFHAGDTARFPPVWLPDTATNEYGVIYVPPK